MSTASCDWLQQSRQFGPGAGVYFVEPLARLPVCQCVCVSVSGWCRGRAAPVSLGAKGCTPCRLFLGLATVAVGVGVCLSLLSLPLGVKQAKPGRIVGDGGGNRSGPLKVESCD